MRFVVFGLSISSSWGNGHATLWRGLCKGLHKRGHHVTFFERDVPYYAEHRDSANPEGCELKLYGDWKSVLPEARRHLKEADVAMITSYCPDAMGAHKLVQDSSVPLKLFYDLDAPVTLERLKAGESVAYIPPDGLRDYDLVLSYTGGPALSELRSLLGARKVAPLYGSVDPEVHRPVEGDARYLAALSYLGTYSADRQAALEMLMIEPARRLQDRRFVIGGSQYPGTFPWMENIFFIPHVPPPDHPAFYCSSRLTLNVTRGPMAEMGYCPSGRLFEAAACGIPVLSDEWDGLDQFFEPGLEILIARTTEHAMDALGKSDDELRNIARAARQRALDSHTALHRAAELEQIVSAARSGEPKTRAGGGT